jgi:hypothetical protein
MLPKLAPENPWSTFGHDNMHAAHRVQIEVPIERSEYPNCQLVLGVALRCPFIPEGAGRCQAGFRPAVSRPQGCLQGVLNWPRGSPLSPRRCRVRASGRAGSRTGRSPAAGGGAGGVLDAGAREPMIKGLRGRAPAVQGSRVCGCRRPTAGLRPGSLLAAFIPSFVPGCPREAWGGFAPGRAGSITGAPAPPWGGGQNERRPRARPRARTGHAACPRWRARRTCPSRIA